MAVRPALSLAPATGRTARAAVPSASSCGAEDFPWEVPRGSEPGEPVTEASPVREREPPKVPSPSKSSSASCETRRSGRPEGSSPRRESGVRPASGPRGGTDPNSIERTRISAASSRARSSGPRATSAPRPSRSGAASSGTGCEEGRTESAGTSEKRGAILGGSDAESGVGRRESRVARGGRRRGELGAVELPSSPRPTPSSLRGRSDRASPGAPGRREDPAADRGVASDEGSRSARNDAGGNEGRLRPSGSRGASLGLWEIGTETRATSIVSENTGIGGGSLTGGSLRKRAARFARNAEIESGSNVPMWSARGASG